jgi:hypothetical protein
MTIIMLCNDVDEIYNDTLGSHLLDLHPLRPWWRLRHVVDHTRPVRAIRLREVDHICIPMIILPAP